MSGREPGWYWVRQAAGMPWEVARTYNGAKFHLLNGEVEREAKFDEIGPRIPAPDVWDELLDCALAVNDALRHHPDHVEFTGSMNLAERFRKVVNEAWHVRSGWAGS